MITARSPTQANQPRALVVSVRTLLDRSSSEYCAGSVALELAWYTVTVWVAEDGPYILEVRTAGDRLGHDDHRHDQCGVRVANFVLEHGPHGRITASELRDSVGIQDNGSS